MHGTYPQDNLGGFLERAVLPPGWRVLHEPSVESTNDLARAAATRNWPDRSVFVAVQHPGEISGATVEKPASTWPDGDFAKPSVAVAWRLDGGPIGS